MEKKKFLTAEEAREQFGIDLDTLQQLVDEGKIRALADRGSWKYRWDELENLANSGSLKSQRPKSSGSPSFSNEPIVAEELSFLELDEEALSAGGTFEASSTATPVTDLSSSEVVIVEEPDQEARAKTPADNPADTASDVRLVAEPLADSFSSDSDVQVVGDASPTRADAPTVQHLEVAQSLSQFDLEGVDSPIPGEISSVVLTPEHAKPQTIPDSDSDVKVVSPPAARVTQSDSDVQVLSERDANSSGSDSDVSVVPAASAAKGSDSDVRVVPVSGSDSDVKAVSGSDASAAILTGKTDDLAVIADSGISLSDDDVDSGLTTAVIAGGSSDVKPRLDKTEFLDSGISLHPVDSGISLEVGDSGISLESSSVVVSGGSEVVKDDSGISLQEDSGLTLESAAESGISLESSSGDLGLDDSDSGISLTPHTTPSLSDQDLDETQPEFDNLEFNSDDFEVKFQSGGTAELDEIVDEDARETLPPPKAGKKPQLAGLSGALDTTDQVADLEISEELDAGDLELDADEEAYEEEPSLEEILDADDEVFDSSEAGVLGDESAVSIHPAAAIAREPSWGLAAHIPIIASAVLLLVNALVLWGGVATMWSGSELPAVPASIVSALGNLF